MTERKISWRGKSPNVEKPYLWASAKATRRAVEAGGSQGLCVYIALCALEMRTPADKKRCFYASLDEVASLSGLTVRTVRKYIRLLHQARLIVQIKPMGKAKINHEACRYIILSRRETASTPKGNKTTPSEWNLKLVLNSTNKESHALTGHEESITPIELKPSPSGGVAHGEIVAAKNPASKSQNEEDAWK